MTVNFNTKCVLTNPTHFLPRCCNRPSTASKVRAASAGESLDGRSNFSTTRQPGVPMPIQGEARPKSGAQREQINGNNY